MLALKIVTSTSAKGRDVRTRRSQPRIHRFKYGSPGPSGAPRRVPSEIVSGQVSAIVAAAYTKKTASASTMLCRPGERVDSLTRLWALERAPHEVVGKLRARLAARRLHHLTDEEAQHLRLTGAILRHGLGMRRD